MTLVKKLVFFILLLGTIISCSDDDRVDNPFLPNVPVNFQANLNLPQFGDLEFPGSTVIVEADGIGIRGLIIHNVNNELFTAFELSDPNHTPNSCSSQSVEGIIATCKCEDGNSYNIVTGQPNSGDGQFGLKAYRIQKQGNSLIITN